MLSTPCLYHKSKNYTMKNKLQKRTRVWNPPSNFSHKGTQRGTKKEGEKTDDRRDR
jgi:hypothetical protein